MLGSLFDVLCSGRLADAHQTGHGGFVFRRLDLHRAVVAERERDLLQFWEFVLHDQPDLFKLNEFLELFLK